MNKDKIFQCMLYEFNNTPSLEEKEEPEKNISYNTAYSALLTNLGFSEKQPDLMIVCNWRGFATKKRISEPKQKVMTKFSSKNNLLYLCLSVLLHF